MHHPIERLEGRALLSMTIWDQAGQVVVANEDGVGSAPAIDVLRDGEAVAHGDQVVVSYEAAAGDYRQALVVDTNGVMRVRHLDGNSPPRDGAPWDDLTKEDPFGTSLKLPPGLIRNAGAKAGDYFLSARVTQINLLTDESGEGILKLRMRGSPVNGPGKTAPVQMLWDITLLQAADGRTRMTIATRATFGADFVLSPSHLGNAEAFRAAMFSSSNNTNATVDWPLGTHDADHLRLLNPDGSTKLDVDLTVAARNSLLLPAKGGPRIGAAMGGWMQLNQVAAAPLNGDPPNISVSINPVAGVSYRAQAFISQDGGTDHNDDNLGAWISRSFASNIIAKGTVLRWTLNVLATDGVVAPKMPVTWTRAAMRPIGGGAQDVAAGSFCERLIASDVDEPIEGRT
jgi:hypothetical protein